MKRYFKCMDCGEIVREDDLKVVVINSEPPFAEMAYGCPVCGSIDLEQIDTCPVCGKPHDDIKHPLCVDCRGKVKTLLISSYNILLDDRHGYEGDPGTGKEIVEAFNEELDTIMGDTQFLNQLERRETK